MNRPGPTRSSIPGSPGSGSSAESLLLATRHRMLITVRYMKKTGQLVKEYTSPEQRDESQHSGSEQKAKGLRHEPVSRLDIVHERHQDDEKRRR